LHIIHKLLQSVDWKITLIKFKTLPILSLEDLRYKYTERQTDGRRTYVRNAVPMRGRVD